VFLRTKGTGGQLPARLVPDDPGQASTTELFNSYVAARLSIVPQIHLSKLFYGSSNGNRL